MNRIQDYALIGNGRSAALVSRTGSIDWLCWPRFDSELVLARLLDPDQGSWSITVDGARVQRRYLPRTAILETVFQTAGGTLVLTDLMPVCASGLRPEHEIVRQIKCVQGRVAFSCDLVTGRRPSKLWSGSWGVIARWSMPQGELILASPAVLQSSLRGVGGTIELEAGERLQFSLSLSQDVPAVLGPSSDPVDETRLWWERFCDRVAYHGRDRDLVLQSAVILKLMIFAPSGAIIASPTTSLPEKIGGSLNWDYRFCWLRDASMTTRALADLDLKHEARTFVNWLLHSTNLSRPKLKVLYDVYGRTPKPERIIPEYAGYLDSRPVRVGNAAAGQEQMDLYGEVIHGAYHILKEEEKIDAETRRMLAELGDYIAGHWQTPDAGMWEVRGRREYFTHSLLLCWAGLSDLLDLFARGLCPMDQRRVGKYLKARQQIAAFLDGTAWSEPLGSFVSSLRGERVDANLLLIPSYGFVSFHEKRMRMTYERIMTDLQTRKGLLLRNREQDEGAFLLCSLWAVEYLARGGGTLQEARDLYTEVSQAINDVGLLSEEFDPLTGDALGNFPLTFSHMGLINAVLALDRREKQEEAHQLRSEV